MWPNLPKDRAVEKERKEEDDKGVVRVPERLVVRALDLGEGWGSRAVRVTREGDVTR